MRMRLRHARVLPWCAALAAACALASAAAAVPRAPEAKDRGDFKLVYNKRPQNPEVRRLLRVLLAAGLPELVRGLNESFALPANVRISLQLGDGPYYDPSRRTIVINYDFVEYVEQLFYDADYSNDQADLDLVAVAVTEFVFFHELGHALVDLYDLPITGREEDAVDELAAVITTQVLEGGGEMALAAALMFGLSSLGKTEYEEADFWDVHSLDKQRFYSILCWVYGSDPKTYRSVVKEAGLGADRLSGCRGEYLQKVRTWAILLDPYLK